MVRSIVLVPGKEGGHYGLSTTFALRQLHPPYITEISCISKRTKTPAPRPSCCARVHFTSFSEERLVWCGDQCQVVSHEGNPSIALSCEDPSILDDAVYVGRQILWGPTQSSKTLLEIVVNGEYAYHVCDKTARDLITQTNRGLKLGISTGNIQGIRGLVDLSFVLQFVHEQRLWSGQRLEILLQDMQTRVIDILHKFLSAFTDHEDTLQDDTLNRRIFIAGALSSLQKYPVDIILSDLGKLSTDGKSKRSESFLFHADNERIYLEFSVWPGPAVKKEIL